MKFWGTKPTDDSGATVRNSQNGAGGAHDGEADEHTRLLPNRLDSDVQYLSPDDPAVSPYNLWSVRFVRGITVLFAILTSLWWIAIFVSFFVSPPGLHARGSTFFAFSFTSLALASLIVTLLFFSAPSKSTRILAAVISVLLLVDALIILAVEKTRHEEAWSGIASVTWALLMSIWTLVADATVQWGKKEEEERLTGRQESRRTLFEWTEVLVSGIAFLVMFLAVVLVTCTLVLRSLDARLAPPGSRFWVDNDKYMVHVFCQGEEEDHFGVKSPTVLLDAGEVPVEFGLWQFAEGALKNGSIARYCFVDRPGYAWSDAAPSPLSAGMATDAVSEALARAGETGPWIVLGAGIGSIYSRIYSSRHGRDVIGLLLVDPLHEELLGRIASPSRGFFLWLRGVLSPLGIDRLGGALLRGRGSSDRVWGRAFRQESKTIFAKLQESLVADTLSKRDVISSRAIQDQETPLVVVTSGLELKRDSEWEAKQRDLSHLTRNLRHWDIVEKAPHHVWETLEGREMIEKRLRQLSRP